jgi:hypothetical protein
MVYLRLSDFTVTAWLLLFVVLHLLQTDGLACLRDLMINKGLLQLAILFLHRNFDIILRSNVLRVVSFIQIYLTETL